MEKKAKATTDPEGIGIQNSIRKCEANLASASDKLRRNVERIANMFGDPTICQICIMDKNWCTKNIHEDKHRFTPKICISIEVRDTVSFYTDHHGNDIDHYYLATIHGHLEVVIESEKDPEDESIRHIYQLSREALKGLIEGRRLAAFLEYILETYQTDEKEYEKAADTSEQLLATLKHPKVVYATYTLPNGMWQAYATFDSRKEAEEAMTLHAQGRRFFITNSKENMEEITKTHKAIEKELTKRSERTDTD